MAAELGTYLGTDDVGAHYSMGPCACGPCGAGNKAAADVEAGAPQFYVAPTEGGLGDGTNGANQAIDAIDMGTSWSAQQGQGATVYFNVTDANWQHNSASGHQALNNAQATAAREAFQMWENVANLNLIETTSTSQADILVHTGNLPQGTAGWAASSYYPHNNTFHKSDVVIANNQSSNPQEGTWDYMVYIHEVGHALGLNHPGDYNGSQGSGGNTFYDNLDASVMSYYQGSHANFSEGFPATPMLYDIATIQHKYGANHNFNAGDDVYAIDGAKVAMTIWDGAGNDTLSGENVAGNHVIDIREGLLNVSAIGDTDVWVAFNANIENATGGTGNDQITGNAMANVLTGNAGNDTLTGGAGNDTLIGGAGNDNYITGQGNDTIRDSDGQGTVNHNGLNIQGTATETGNGTYTLQINGVTFTLTLNGGNLTMAAGNSNVTIENFQNGMFGINLPGDVPSGGNPTPPADPTPPTDPNPGDNNGNDGNSGNGNNDGNTGGGNTGGGNPDPNPQPPADPTPPADPNPNPGGGNADSSMEGGAGNDRYTSKGNSNDYFDGNGGNDRIKAGDGNDTMVGGDGNDNIKGEAGNDVLYGDAGDDKIDGGAGDDRIFGGTGNDNIKTGDGNNQVNAGAGDDTIKDGSGNDTIKGGEGNDNIKTSDGNDVVNAGGGNDTIKDGAGNDILSGDAGNDTIKGSHGDDTLLGGSGNDDIKDTQGNNQFNGGAGDDNLRGGNGDDVMIGGSGNDVLDARGGTNQLTGGAGADTFIFKGNSTTTVTDFQSGIDMLDVKGNVNKVMNNAEVHADGIHLNMGNTTVILDGVYDLNIGDLM